MNESPAQGAIVRRAAESDLTRIAELNSQVFLGDRGSPETAEDWVRCWFRAFPLYQYFVIVADGMIAGYAGWQIHGGFRRPEPVVEFEQMGVDPQLQTRGLGSKLMEESMREVVAWLLQKNNRIESHVSVVVWVYGLNFNAIKVYAKLFVEGMTGMRTQYGTRAEIMLRRRVPMVREVRDD